MSIMSALTKGLAGAVKNYKEKATGSSSSSSSGSSGSSGRGSSSSSSGKTTAGNGGYTGSTYTKYNGGNSAMESELKKYQQQYQDARARGDADGMQAANNAANQVRNSYGYAAEHATSDINKFRGNSSSKSNQGYWPAGDYYQQYQQLQAQQPSYTEDLSDYLDQLYAAQRKQAMGEIESSYQKALNNLKQSTIGVDQKYTDAANNAAANSELAKRNFMEYAAASGLNSGAAAQSEIARSTQLNSDLTKLDQDQNAFYQNIELQKAQAEQDYNSAIAEAINSNDAARAQALYQEKVRVQQELTAQANQNMQNALSALKTAYQQQRDQVSDSQWAKEFQYQQDRDAVSDSQWNKTYDYNTRSELAKLLAQNGYFGGLSSLGASQDAIDFLQNNWNTMNELERQQALATLGKTYASYSGSGGSSGGSGRSVRTSGSSGSGSSGSASLANAALSGTGGSGRTAQAQKAAGSVFGTNDKYSGLLAGKTNTANSSPLPPVASAASSGFREVSGQLSRMAQNTKEQYIRQDAMKVIQAGYKNKLITEDEARTLAKRYGIDL